MSDLTPNPSPRLVSLEALIFIVILGITGSSIYLLQQQRIDRLQAQNQVLQQQVDSLQADNLNQQRTIEGLNATKTTLMANVQLLCQQRPTRIGLFFKNALDGLMENDSDNFAEKWQQICGNAPTAPAPLQ